MDTILNFNNLPPVHVKYKRPKDKFCDQEENVQNWRNVCVKAMKTRLCKINDSTCKVEKTFNKLTSPRTKHLDN